jgi:SPP1 gp7 family putative phage head morphogenesis protein
LEGVTVDAEYTTADDNKVCPKCRQLEGNVYTIDEARGIIPVHPNCRCAWNPVVRDPSGVALR